MVIGEEERDVFVDDSRYKNFEVFEEKIEEYTRIFLMVHITSDFVDLWNVFILKGFNL